jgi:glycosyltransferase involved in cell wall biosynthesis
MKILVVSFCPPAQAISDNFIQIANDLSSVCDVSILCPDYLNVDAYSFKARYLLPYSRKYPLSLFSVTFLKTVFKLIFSRFDAVFFFDQNVVNVLFSSFCRTANTVIWWHEPVSNGRHALINRLVYSCNDYFMTRKSRKIIVACNSILEDVPLSLRPKIEIIPLPFLEQFSIEESPEYQSFKAADLVFFGNIETYKGLDILAQALSILYEQGVRLSLCVLGRGNLETKAPKLLALAQAYPEDIVLLNEYQPYSKIVDYIRGSHAVILPYLSATGTNTIAIAYRYAKPVIATRTGSFRDYVVEGETGWLAEPGDVYSLVEAIKSVAFDRQKAKVLGANAYRYYCDNFTQSSVTQKLMDVFRQ